MKKKKKKEKFVQRKCRKVGRPEGWPTWKLAFLQGETWAGPSEILNRLKFENF